MPVGAKFRNKSFFSTAPGHSRLTALERMSLRPVFLRLLRRDPGVITAHTNNGQSAAAVNPSKGAVTTAQTSNGTKAAYNPHTGNAAVSQTNQNGVKTTQTSHGAEAKTKNGKGVATGPNGATCAKGVNEQGCKKE
jgi:hypothetical protein